MRQEVYSKGKKMHNKEKTKKKTIEQSGVRKGSPMEEVAGLWREGFKERVSFEF